MLKMPGYNRGTKRKKCIPFKISVSLEMSGFARPYILMYANFPYALTKNLEPIQNSVVLKEIAPAGTKKLMIFEPFYAKF